MYATYSDRRQTDVEDSRQTDVRRASSLNPVHRLKHKHKLKHCLFRLVAVPSSGTDPPTTHSVHLTLSATAIIVITTQNARSCNSFIGKIHFDTMGRGTPHILPHRGLQPLSTLRSQVWTSPYAYMVLTTMMIMTITT